MDWLVLGDLLLLLGLTLRLTRLIVADDLGLWFVRAPLMKWSMDRWWPVHSTKTYEETQQPLPWHARLVTGLSCPFCVGFWIGAACLLSLVLVGGPGYAPEWWRFIAGVFALNWVAAHLGARVGDTSDE